MADDMVYFWIIVLLLGLPVSVLILRNSPDEMGLLPDGEARATDSRASAEQRSRAQALMRGGPLGSDRWTDSFKSWPMWQLSIGYFVCGITTASILDTLRPLGNQRRHLTSQRCMGVRHPDGHQRWWRGSHRIDL